MEKLNKTFFIDIDGTIFVHRSNEELDDMIKRSGEASHLNEVPISEGIKFVKSISPEDSIIFTTARLSRHKEHTIKLLYFYRIRFNDILFDLPSGPRILINDSKPVGTCGNRYILSTAYAMNVDRNSGNFSEYNKITKLMQRQIGY